MCVPAREASGCGYGLTKLIFRIKLELIKPINYLKGVIMLTSQSDGNKTDLLLSGKVFLQDSANLPFVTIVQREKTYKANRGTVKEQIEETARVVLSFSDIENGDTAVFSGEDHTFRIRPRQIDGGVFLEMEGEPGWAYEFSIPAEEKEAVFGGGEQYRNVNLRGERVVNFVSEHIKAITIIEKALLPRMLYREKKHSEIGSYAPMPVFVTDRKRLVYFDTPADGYSDFSGSDRLQFMFDSCPRSLTLLKAEDYPTLLQTLTERIPNRQYIPSWCHDGMILSIQGGTQNILDKTFAMLDAGAKISGVWSQDWSGCNRTVMGYQVWWNWEVDESLYPNLKEAIEKLNERGVRFLAYINPYLVKGSRYYELCKSRGFLITHTDGSIYHIKSTTFDAGMIDLTNPEAVRFVKEELIGKNMLSLGVSGWMADFGEYLPLDCVLHDGDPRIYHNQWPVLWAKINREAIEEYGREDVFFFTRSGYLGIQNYAPVLWNGDQHTDTTKDYGMPCVMPASFSLGFSGVPMVHCDTGGFFSFGKLKRNEELFTRWMEMCCFSLLMRSHESIRPWANAQFDAEKVKNYTVLLTQIHAALKPYILDVAEQAAGGIPALRPDFWFAEGFEQGKDPYSYFLGDDLYVCPVIRKGAKRRKLFLPKGEWVCFWNGREYHGEQKMFFPSPLGRIPVFYRKNSSYTEVFRRAAEIINYC